MNDNNEYILDKDGQWFLNKRTQLAVKPVDILRLFPNLVPPVALPLLAPETLAMLQNPFDPKTIVLVTRIHEVPFRTKWILDEKMDLVPCWASGNDSSAVDPGHALYWKPPKEFKVLFAIIMRPIPDSSIPSWLPTEVYNDLMALSDESGGTIGSYLGMTALAPVLVFQDTSTGETRAAPLPNTYNTGFVCMGEGNIDDFRKEILKILNTKTRPGAIGLDDYLQAMLLTWSHSFWNSDLLKNPKWLEKMIRFEAGTCKQIEPKPEDVAEWKSVSDTFSQVVFNDAFEMYHKVWKGMP